MTAGAPRHPLRPWCSLARGAYGRLGTWLAALAFGTFAVSSPAMAQVVAADYAEPTTRYDHAILGDAVEWGALRLTLASGKSVLLRLPSTRVFEDLAPRLVDLDGDGAPEVIAIETDLSLGARLSVYGQAGLIAATPYIGRTHRWLAPIGAADLDGDGRVEIAYIDRPHLAKTLRIWRFEDGALTHVADQPGLTNHRIGWDFIPGGVRDCGEGPELITADANWSNVTVSRLEGGQVTSRALAPYSAKAVERALICTPG